MKQFQYNKYKIKSPKDVDSLKEIIETHGNFKKSDYLRLCNKVDDSNIPVILRSRLQKLIYPLIQKDNSCHTSKSFQRDLNMASTEVGKSKNGIFEKTYVASDFTIEDGCIKIGEWKLPSKRIRKTEPSLLANITHNFKIACESSKQHTFHFVPYSDLSVLLEAVNKQEEMRLIGMVSPHIECFIKYIFNNTHNFQKKVEKKIRFLYDLLISFNIIPFNDTLQNFTSKIWECDTIVPKNDIVIYDGYIVVKTDNCQIAEKYYWKYIEDKHYWFIKSYSHLNSESLIKNMFSKRLSEAFEIQRKKSVIIIKTYMAKESFEEAFFNYQPNYLNVLFYNEEESEVLNKDYFMFPHTFIDNDVNEGFSALVNLRKDVINATLSSTFIDVSPKELSEIRNRARNILTSGWEKNVQDKLLHCYSMSIREVTKYYFQREPIPMLSLCQDKQRILRFSEVYSHYSDSSYSQTERSISYLIIDSESSLLFLCPSDRRYSNYRFYIDKGCCCILLAAYAIIILFSSYIKNKREYIFSGRVPIVLQNYGVREVRRLN